MTQYSTESMSRRSASRVLPLLISIARWLAEKVARLVVGFIVGFLYFFLPGLLITWGNLYISSIMGLCLGAVFGLVLMAMDDDSL